MRVLAITVAAVLCLGVANAHAGKKKSSSKAAKPAAAAKPAPAPAAPKEEPEVLSTICVEAETDMVLVESNADMQRPPASMIKMMLMLLVAEGLYKNSWTLDTPITTSEHARDMGGTQVNLDFREMHPLGKMMEAVAVVSANDAAMAVAENLWGSEEKYLEAANARAQELGMTNTVLRSVHGLPPSAGEEPDQTTARDMATLGRHLVAFPWVLQLTSMKELQFRPENTVEHSTNHLLSSLPDCDGLKTGYIRAAGFCITATAKRNGVRLIATVMGFRDKNVRDSQAKALIEENFSQVKRIDPVPAGFVLPTPTPVENCLVKSVVLTAKEPISLIVKAADAARVETKIEAPVSLVPPQSKGTEPGAVIVLLDGQELKRTPLVLQEDLVPMTWRERTWRGVKGWFGSSE